jgi:hypothetical protein
VNEQPTEAATDSIVKAISDEQKSLYYQLSIPEFGLLTSVPVHQMTVSGLNDTFTFSLDQDETHIIGLTSEFVDKQLIAERKNLRGNKKKRFLTP